MLYEAVSGIHTAEKGDDSSSFWYLQFLLKLGQLIVINEDIRFDFFFQRFASMKGNREHSNKNQATTSACTKKKQMDSHIEFNVYIPPGDRARPYANIGHLTNQQGIVLGFWC